VVTQSGGVGIALLEQLAAVGLGVSTLVSSGDKYDVSGNDLLLWWQRDDTTDLAVLHLESFGNPRKFARLARAVAERKPVLAVRTGTSEAGARAAASHTAAAATPAATRDALFEQAGVLAVDTFSELLGSICALSWQPLPAGDRVAIVSNAGGAGVLAADACAEAGLVLPTLSERTLEALRALVPSHASLANPVDTTAGVSDEVFGLCVRAVLDDPGVDAVLVITAPTAVTDPVRAIGPALAEATSPAARSTVKPVLAVLASQTALVKPLYPAGDGPPAPVFADPALAVATLATLARYARWRRRPAGTVPHLPGIDTAAARAVCAGFLAANPDGGWLGPTEVTALLSHAGLPVLAGEVVAPDGAAAVAAADRVGRPVAVKTITPGVLHKSRAGGLALGLRTTGDIHLAVARMRERFGDDLTGVLVQPMTEPGRELLVGIQHDDIFGPLIVLALGGVDTDLIADRTCRLVPLTDTDATGMLTALRAWPMLFDTDPPAVRRQDAEAVTDVLLRIARLAELIPEIAEADINPVIVRNGDCRIPDARIRLRLRHPTDPFLRRLRT
jgi:acyl-CoA synthetase (NDP forming)